ncbi:MAG: CbiX/SirB N-terminal domain-containing protein [Algisphaera sp.]
MNPPTATSGVIICDHGSRRTQSNDSLKEIARLFAARFPESAIVEPAHMELAMPDIAAAYSACVARGATHIVVLPFFLAKGKHWTRDIPSLTAQAAAHHPHTQYQIAEPLGADDLILDLLKKRLDANDQPTLASGENDPRLDQTEPTQRRIQCATCPFTLALNGTVSITPGSGVIVNGVRH